MMPKSMWGTSACRCGAERFVDVGHTVLQFVSHKMTASSNHRGTDAGWCGFVQIYFGMIEKK